MNINKYSLGEEDIDYDFNLRACQSLGHVSIKNTETRAKVKVSTF